MRDPLARGDAKVSRDLEPGRVLGKYEILRKLAAGGMAEIYLARVRGQAGFEKLVVLKRILPHIADDPAFVTMFLDEARLAATLQHPNIADVYDVGEIEGELFFTMEYVHGQDVRTIKLAARQRNESIPLAIALAIVHGTASALDYAHDKRGADGQLLGLVHRDVSTSNVMISYDGAIKLLDFGIAHATLHRHKTQTGTLKGKVPYMSPEQCRGQVLDRRSDLFSLGVLLFELTIGRRPFRGDSDFDIMNQIVNQGAPAPSSVIKGYPPDLEAIVMKLLARHPDARYQTADEMIHALEPFLAQHQLWVSTKPLSRYMRLVFADRIAAWEQAELEGVSLVQHVTASVTAQSQQSELVTPPSSFPALAPLSEQMPAVMRSSSRELEAQAVAEPLATTAQPSVEPSSPEPRGGGRRLAFVFGGLFVGLLGIGAYLWTNHESKPKRAEEPAAAPAAPRAEEPKPAPTPAEPTKPAEPAPDDELAVSDEPPVAKPPVPATTPSKKPTARPKTPPKGKASKPADPAKPKHPAKPKDPKPKDPEWDPNSPFLPPN